ncbi:GtrA family protein [Streptomyces antnestii]|uniref:GtrA family protein n=1 Tax=Streptomyces antnestii TaxID=2494256 RepID=UPI001CB9126F|nr:GtrA family protein [Streptomyces sp. San01]
MVGGMGMIVNTVALYALHRLLHLPLIAASATAVELAVIHNYVLNARWTFHTDVRSLRRFVRFNASMLAGLAVNVALLWALVHDRVPLVVANVLAIGAAFAVNYTFSTLWVWSRPRGSSPC